MRLISFLIFSVVVYLGSFVKSDPKYMYYVANFFLWLLNIEIKLTRPLPQDHAIFANHQGWVDSMIVASMVPCRFIGKSDIKEMPFVGRAAKNVGTLFVVRGLPLDRQEGLKQDMLNSRYPIVCFPEGTTSDKIGKLKLGIIDFVEKIDVPAIVLYMKFTPQSPILFTGQETLTNNVLKLLSYRGKIIVEVDWAVLERSDSRGKFPEQIYRFFKDMELSGLYF